MTIEYPNEPIGVEARLDQDGRWVPLAFVWRGQRYHIQQWGRQHTEEAGGESRHHFLVQTEDQDTWELCYTEGRGEWRLLRHWLRSYLAA
jgi:hypothetical protein